MASRMQICFCCFLLDQLLRLRLFTDRCSAFANDQISDNTQYKRTCYSGKGNRTAAHVEGEGKAANTCDQDDGRDKQIPVIIQVHWLEHL